MCGLSNPLPAQHPADLSLTLLLCLSSVVPASTAWPLFTLRVHEAQLPQFIHSWIPDFITRAAGSQCHLLACRFHCLCYDLSHLRLHALKPRTVCSLSEFVEQQHEREAVTKELLQVGLGACKSVCSWHAAHGMVSGVFAGGVGCMHVSVLIMIGQVWLKPGRRASAQESSGKSKNLTF